MSAVVTLGAWTLSIFWCEFAPLAAASSSASASPTTAARSTATTAVAGRRRALRKRLIRGPETVAGDHARNQARRDRRRGSMVPAKFVTDSRSDTLPAEASSCTRDDASASVIAVHVAVAETHRRWNE